jgi:streptomycin 3"-adenylyltransferase
MKRKNLGQNACPIARALDVIGDGWSLLIVRDALAGKTRFGEFQRSLGLARNILSARLRKLVFHGILQMQPAADGSAYQEYVLTAKGRLLQGVLAALQQWSESCLSAPDAPHEAGGQALPALTRAASSGLDTPPCAADQATGFSRKRRTSASAASEK